MKLFFVLFFLFFLCCGGKWRRGAAILFRRPPRFIRFSPGVDPTDSSSSSSSSSLIQSQFYYPGNYHFHPLRKKEPTNQQNKKKNKKKKCSSPYFSEYSHRKSEAINSIRLSCFIRFNFIQIIGPFNLLLHFIRGNNSFIKEFQCSRPSNS